MGFLRRANIGVQKNGQDNAIDTEGKNRSGPWKELKRRENGTLVTGDESTAGGPKTEDQPDSGSPTSDPSPASTEPTEVTTPISSIVESIPSVSPEATTTPIVAESTTTPLAAEVSTPPSVEPTQVPDPPVEVSTQLPVSSEIPSSPPQVSSAVEPAASTPPIVTTPEAAPVSTAIIPLGPPTESISAGSQDLPQGPPVSTSVAASKSAAPDVGPSTPLGVSASPTAVANSPVSFSSANQINPNTIATIATIISKGGSGSATSLLATISASLVPSGQSALAIAETEAPIAQSTFATVTQGGSDNGNTISGASPTGTTTGKGGLNVTQTSKPNSSSNNTTIAISISVISAGTIALSILAYFLIRRYLRNRRLNGSARAESPPHSPLLDKFDPQKTMPSSPLPTFSSDGDAHQGVWNTETSMVEWGVKGQEKIDDEKSGLGRYGNTGPAPLSPLPKLPRRETLRIFPNMREKLGGKALPKDF